MNNDQNEKTEMPNTELSKSIRPFLKAMDFVKEIIAERNEAIEKMERIRKWDLRPNSRKDSGLPCPRIEFEHLPSEKYGWEVSWCIYWLVFKLSQNDIRAEDEDGQLGIFRERYIPMGETRTDRGRNLPPIRDGVVDSPFRDGAHAIWDSAALGLPNLPIYVRCGDIVTVIRG